VNGNFIWAKRLGGRAEDKGNSLALDAKGNIYITGFFSKIVDFDPENGKFKLTTQSNYGKFKDVFITKLNTDGIFLWSFQIGGDRDDIGNDISIDVNNNILIEGDCYCEIDFDIGKGIFFIEPKNGWYGENAFRLKLNQK